MSKVIFSKDEIIVHLKGGLVLNINRTIEPNRGLDKLRLIDQSFGDYNQFIK